MRRAITDAAAHRARQKIELTLHQTESLYHTLADAIPGVVFTNDPDGNAIYINHAWTDYTGQPVEEALRDGWHKVVHPDDLPRTAKWWETCVRTGEPRDIEYRVRGADGGYRWLLVRSIPMRGEFGDIIKWVGTATDITAQKQAEMDHQRLLGQLDAIIGNMNEGLVVADAKGNVLTMNPVGLRTQGLDSVDSLRRNINDLAHLFQLSDMNGRVLPFTEWPLGRAIRGETFSNYEVRILRLDTGKTWIGSYAGAPVRAAGGEIEMVIVTFRDVTDQKQSAVDLALAKEQAEAANRMKDEFLATLSHELRTPLNAILGWTQLLLADGADPADFRHGLETIERNAHFQTQLVEDLLDVSRIISGKTRLNIRPVDLRNVIVAAIDSMKPTADARGVTLHRPENLEMSLVSGDPDRLQQIIWNLLSNAIKFTPRGGDIRVCLSRVASRIEISVTDTGQGISADFLPHVFERFRQADGTISRKQGGLGLGLAIVRHLTELHGGSVSASSAGEGHGAMFTVSLPLIAAYVPGDFRDKARAAPENLHARNLLNGVRVLVVDDEVDARALVAAVLKKHKAQVTIAASASEAIEAIQRDPPDVLISDIGMPGEDGYGLIRRIRKLPPNQGGHTPAAALTAYARSEDRARALLSGFQAHLPKPVDANELIALVVSLAAQRETTNSTAPPSVEKDC